MCGNRQHIYTHRDFGGSVGVMVVRFSLDESQFVAIFYVKCIREEKKKGLVCQSTISIQLLNSVNLKKKFFSEIYLYEMGLGQLKL